MRILKTFPNDDQAPQASAGMLTAILVPKDCFPSLSGFRSHLRAEFSPLSPIHMCFLADGVLDAKRVALAARKADARAGKIIAPELAG